jgi:hypothetical protein
LKEQKEEEESRPADHLLVQSQNNILELEIRKSPDHWILFTDPETQTFYRYYLDRRNYIKVESLANDKMKEKVK